MADDLPDWLKDHAQKPTPSTTEAESTHSRHLGVLRKLLAHDYLTRIDWSLALTDLARMARAGLDADRAMVAFLDTESELWRAIDDEGQELDHETISLRGSAQVLERVVQLQGPVLTSTHAPLAVRSASVLRHDIQSVLAVPLYWWDVAMERPTRHLGACLYVHRTGGRAPFTQDDIELVQDIARIVQPNLNLLRYLRVVEDDLKQHKQALERARRGVELHEQLGGLETRDPSFARHVIGPLQRVSRANKVGILILGPTGSGKTHLARSYHRACPRRDGPFVTLDCSQVTSVETLSAELFGYAPHSGYANAPARGRPGKAQLADGGTLFIDEIGTLPAQLQQNLLRLVQEGVFAALGASAESQVNVQIIAATNNDLQAMVDANTFREDLYWRLREIVVRTPPLDERQADIPLLVKNFLERARRRFERDDAKEFTPEALHRLVRHPWSLHGNIRGLEHTVNRAVLLAAPGSAVIDLEGMDFEDSFYQRQSAHQRQSAAPVRVTRAVRPTALSETLLRKALKASMERLDHNASAMARDPELLRQLGRSGDPLPLSTLNLWMRELGLHDQLQRGRQQQRQDRYRDIVDAIRQCGSGSAAARHLGISRDALVWQLRKYGKTIGDILDEG